MARAVFNTSGLTGSFSKANMNNQFNALFQGDFAPLRPRAQAVPVMTLQVASAIVESFYQQVWRVNTGPETYAGGNTPAISAPAGNPRIDLLYLNAAGVLTWITGAEAPAPVAPNYEKDGIPICLVYCKTTMTKIVNYEDKDANPSEGYIYRDIRPFMRYVVNVTYA